MGRTIFSKYVSNKIEESRHILDEDENLKKPPFITISREFGCSASNIGKKLSEELSKMKNSEGKKVQWKFVDHEIIASAASEMGIDSDIAGKMIYQKIDDITYSSFFDITFSKYTKPSEITIKNSIGRMVVQFANQGYVIILGRGGVSITRNFPNSLHIKLEAPLDWRLKKVMERENLPKDKALSLIKKIEKDRAELRSYFEGKKSEDSIFDLIFNTKSLSTEEIIEAIKAVLIERKHIK